MSKDSRFRKSYRASASKLHVEVGNLLRNATLLKNYKIYQEYPVNRVNPSYKSGREHFDWVIIDLKLVIECHGEQHYKPVCFGGITEEEAKANLLRQRERDLAKQIAAEQAGWTYVVIRYDEDISLDCILGKISEYKQASRSRETLPRVAVSEPRNDRHLEQLARAREYRKRRYRELKQRRKAKDANRRQKSGDAEESGS